LEAKLTKKNEVALEPLEETVKLKNKSGEMRPTMDEHGSAKGKNNICYTEEKPVKIHQERRSLRLELRNRIITAIPAAASA
jgi:hypothetical protein